MGRLDYLRVDVFTDRPFHGNPLAVFPDAGDLDTDTMQALAREMNLSETVFVLPAPPEADLALRIFTIDRELPFAGHPTVGAVHALAETDRLTIEPNGSTILRCSLAAGILPAEVVAHEGRVQIVHVEQRVPQFGEPFDDLGLAARALGLPVDALCPAGLPIRVVDTGIPWLLIPLADLRAMRQLSPDPFACAALAERADTDLLFSFTQDVEDHNCTAHGRHVWFCPVTPGEDPATGSAAGCIGAYLTHEEVVLAAPTAEMWIEQGIEIGRPSRIYVEVTRRGGKVSRVRVGGRTVIVGRGEITFLPEA